MHQLSLQTLFQIRDYGTDFSKYQFFFSYPLSLAWVSLSIPVMYAHMLRARGY